MPISDLADVHEADPVSPSPDRTVLPAIRTFWKLFRWICDPHQHDLPATSVLFQRTMLLRIVASQLISWRIPGPELPSTTLSSYSTLWTLPSDQIPGPVLSWTQLPRHTTP